MLLAAQQQHGVQNDGETASETAAMLTVTVKVST